MRCYAPATAAVMVGVSTATMSKWLDAGNAVGFDLEIIRTGHGNRRRLLTEQCVLALADIRKQTQIKDHRPLAAFSTAVLVNCK